MYYIVESIEHNTRIDYEYIYLHTINEDDNMHNLQHFISNACDR